MARTPAQRGTFGRWLTRVREERFERQADALEAMRRLAGLTISPSEYAQWEAGSRVPRADNPKRERLYEFFGSRPDDEPDQAPAESDLIQALRDQTAAMTELINELRLARSTPAPADLEMLLRYAREQGWLSPADDPDRQPVGRS